MREVMIQTKNLQKSFEGNEVLRNVTLEIAQGEFAAVMGQSGCGKSTLGRTIIRLQAATDGQVLLNGEFITHVKGSRLVDGR